MTGLDHTTELHGTARRFLAGTLPPDVHGRVEAALRDALLVGKAVGPLADDVFPLTYVPVGVVGHVTSPETGDAIGLVLHDGAAEMRLLLTGATVALLCKHVSEAVCEALAGAA